MEARRETVNRTSTDTEKLRGIRFRPGPRERAIAITIECLEQLDVVRDRTLVVRGGLTLVFAVLRATQRS